MTANEWTNERENDSLSVFEMEENSSCLSSQFYHQGTEGVHRREMFERKKETGKTCRHAFDDDDFLRLRLSTRNQLRSLIFTHIDLIDIQIIQVHSNELKDSIDR